VDITEFNAARLDEDEAVARAATGRFSGRWRIDADGNVQDEDTGGGGNAYVACGPYGGGVDDEDGAHIARYDPDRALREVAAKRGRLALMTEATAEMDRLLADEHAGRVDQAMAIGRARSATVAVKHDATVWSDHPDYRAGWKP
jgi:hypothetical protein